MRAVVVFDTNVLFSGVGWKGKPYQCLERARAGSVEGVTFAQLIEELSEKLIFRRMVGDGKVNEQGACRFTLHRHRSPGNVQPKLANQSQAGRDPAWIISGSIRIGTRLSTLRGMPCGTRRMTRRWSVWTAL